MAQPTTREIPLRDLFITIGDYFRNGLRYWWVIAVVGLVFAIWWGGWAKQQLPLYGAPLTFVLNEESSRPAVGGILGQLGLEGSGGATTSPDKITALAKSQKIIHGLLLDTVLVDGVADRLVNHVISEYELVERWELPDDERKIVNGQLTKMTEQEKSLLKRMHFYVLSEEEEILTFASNEDTGILTLEARSRNQDLSLAMSYGLYDRLSKFYTRESTGGSRATVERLRAKADSLGSVLSRAEYQLASLMDTRLGVTQRRELVRRAQAERNVQLLNLTYLEVLRNLETASFALSTQTPFFQTVDVPFSPLPGLRPNWIETAVRGLAVGAFLGFLLVSVLKCYQDIMRGDDVIKQTTT